VAWPITEAHIDASFPRVETIYFKNGYI